MAKTRSLKSSKQWLTVAEAADYLTGLSYDDVAEEDILQLALERRLTLSVRFLNRVTGLKLPPGYTAVRTDYGALDSPPEPNELPEAPFVALPEGMYDLPLTGAELVDVEHQYQQLTGGPELRRGSTYAADGPFVRSLLTGEEFRLQRGPREEILMYDDGRYLPHGAVFVVRPQELERFAQLPQPPSPPEPTKDLGTRERNTLLKIIGALCKLADLDTDRPSKTASVIEKATEVAGERVSARRIEDHIKQAREALGRKSS